MTAFLAIFGMVFLLNTVPAFAPPTWMAMSLIGLNHPELSPLPLALTAAVAATCGRLTLARLSNILVRRRLMSESSRENIDALRQSIEGRRNATAGLMLLYAFTPLPTNYLFIAYGLTAMPLRIVAAPFFTGRFISYTGWTVLAQTASRRLDLESLAAGSYLSGYFVFSQFVFLALVYVFAKIDWKLLLTQRKVGWIRSERRLPKAGD